VNVIDVSTRVGWPVYAGIALLSGLLVWILIAPDKAWRLERAFVGWQYRDGHRIELSAAGRLWVRFCTVVSLVILLVVAGATVNWSAGSRVETGAWPGGGTVYDVGDPVESPGCVIRIVACLRSDVVFPIEVTDFEALDPVSGHDVLPDGTNLLLYVADRFFPTHLVISEESERVTVSLYGKCAPRYPWDDPVGSAAAECRSDSSSLLDTRGVVPVTLDQPLGVRTIVDGHRDAPISPEPADPEPADLAPVD
jgi:hypothetical protein